MIRAKQSIVGVLKSSAGVGAWSGGIYGLLVVGSSSWVFGAAASSATISNALATFVLGCLGGVAIGAFMGALVGAAMGVGIYDFLKHEGNR
jgi:hypothetical protein